MSDRVASRYENRALGQVCTLQRGFDLPTDRRVPGRFPLITSSGPTDTHQEAMVKGPGVVTGRSGSIGNVFFVEEDFWPLNTALYVKDFHGNDERYVYYLLQAFDLSRFASGAGVPTLNRNHVHDAEVLVAAELDEQKRIVAALDQAFDALDRARANAEANLSSSIKLSEAWLQQILEDSQDWPTFALADVCENLDRLRVPITKGDRKPGDVPYYGASGVVDHVKDHLFDEDLLLVSEDGANLLARTYPIAFSISGRAWVNNHAHVLRFDDPTTQEFVRLFLNSISLEPFVTGMAQPKLNQAALNGIPIPMPEPDLREQIVRNAHQLSMETGRVKSSYEAQCKDIAALRQSLLQVAFSGQLS